MPERPRFNPEQPEDKRNSPEAGQPPSGLPKQGEQQPHARGVNRPVDSAGRKRKLAFGGHDLGIEGDWARNVDKEGKEYSPYPPVPPSTEEELLERLREKFQRSQRGS
jgi:hypothetical protein